MPGERARLTWLLGGHASGVGIRHTWDLNSTPAAFQLCELGCRRLNVSAHSRYLSPFWEPQEKTGRSLDSLCPVSCHLDLLERKCSVVVEEGLSAQLRVGVKYVFIVQ